MRRIFQSVCFVFVFVFLAWQSVSSQDKSPEPRVVINLEKPHAGEDPTGVLGPFGTTCKSRKNSEEQRSYEPGLDKPISIAEWMGAPITLVKVRRYGAGWKSPAAVRMRIVKLLETRSGEVYPGYEPWDEMVFSDIVATVQFSDHTEGALEISGVHVCFCTHSGTALWLRVFAAK